MSYKKRKRIHFRQFDYSQLEENKSNELAIVLVGSNGQNNAVNGSNETDIATDVLKT